MSDVERGGASDADGFYRAFEEKHRGSRELIKSRLIAYLRFVEPLKAFHAPASAIDLGCGRGEWLELLAENGFQAEGVDLDEGMLAACRERGLNAANRDAIEFLTSLPDESQSIISGFHIAEHLPFSDLRALVRESLRILKPGGLLILETPNPENLKVSTLSFYLDPTHHHPLPPDLLSFLPEYYGFMRVKIVRLQEPPGLSSAPEITLNDVLSGASPDYAIVAQKAGARSLLSATDKPFNEDYGLSLGRLVQQFDAQLASQVGKVENLSLTLEGVSAALHSLDDRLVEQMDMRDRLLQADEAKITYLDQRFDGAEKVIANCEDSIKRLHQQILDLATASTASKQDRQELELARLGGLIEAKNSALEAHDAEIQRLHRHIAWLDTIVQASKSQIETLRQELDAVYASRSWSATAPLRSLSTGLRWFIRGTWAWVTLRPGSRPRRVVQRVVGRPSNSPETRSYVPEQGLAATTRIQEVTESIPNDAARLLSPPQPTDTITVKGLISTWDVDLNAESDGVRRLYRRLANARRPFLAAK